MTAVSGAALTAIFFLPKESDRCRLSANFRVFGLKLALYGSQDVFRTVFVVLVFLLKTLRVPGRKPG